MDIGNQEQYQSETSGGKWPAGHGIRLWRTLDDYSVTLQCFSGGMVEEANLFLASWLQTQEYTLVS